ncbi:MAG: hypothetical protein J6S04_02740 [Clostridia bacterium]|nr:hypothetical protein [Clostridia bacterium]
MFDYTKSVFNKTIDDLKNIAFISALLMQLFQVGYLIYALCIGSGITIANIVLLVLSTAYLGFMLYVHWQDVAKSTKKLLKNIYRWSKRFIKMFTLGVSIYGLFITASETITTKSLVSIILVVFMLIAWILDVLFSLIIMILERRKDLFFNAFKMDFEPVFKAKNFIDKIKGKEVEEEIVSTKTRNTLDRLKSSFKEMKAQQKQDKKSAKAALKAEKAALKAQNTPVK